METHAQGVQVVRKFIKSWFPLVPFSKTVLGEQRQCYVIVAIHHVVDQEVAYGNLVHSPQNNV